MKQSITHEQFIKFVKEEYTGSMDKLFDALGIGHGEVLMPEHFNIGKMIEILQPYYIDISHDYFSYEVSLNKLDGEVFGLVNQFERVELCDALWEAVKEVL